MKSSVMKKREQKQKTMSNSIVLPTHERRGKSIVDLATNQTTPFKYHNEAKRASRKLSQAGNIVRVAK